METVLPWSAEEVDKGRRVARLTLEGDVLLSSILMTMSTGFSKLHLEGRMVKMEK